MTSGDLSILLFDEKLAVQIDGADAAQGSGPLCVSSRRHEMPGFAVGFEKATDPASVGIKGQALEGRDLIHRDNVPNVCRNDVDNEDVNLRIPKGFGISFRAARTWV
jgi:hypothetical protein